MFNLSLFRINSSSPGKKPFIGFKKQHWHRKMLNSLFCIDYESKITAAALNIRGSTLQGPETPLHCGYPQLLLMMIMRMMMMIIRMMTSLQSSTVTSPWSSFSPSWLSWSSSGRWRRARRCMVWQFDSQSVGQSGSLPVCQSASLPLWQSVNWQWKIWQCIVWQFNSLNSNSLDRVTF